MSCAQHIHSRSLHFRNYSRAGFECWSGEFRFSFIFSIDIDYYPESIKCCLFNHILIVEFKLAFLLYFWNTRLLRNLVGVRSRYTLSERYQLQENIRAFRVSLLLEDDNHNKYNDPLMLDHKPFVKHISISKEKSNMINILIMCD